MVKVKKKPEPMPLTPPTDFTEENGKRHGPDYLDPDPSLWDSPLNKKKRDNKKKRCKHRKYDLSDPSSSDDSDTFDESDHRRKRRKGKSNRKKGPIKLCAHLTEKSMTTAYNRTVGR